MQTSACSLAPCSSSGGGSPIPSWICVQLYRIKSRQYIKCNSSIEAPASQFGTMGCERCDLVHKLKIYSRSGTIAPTALSGRVQV